MTNKSKYYKRLFLLLGIRKLLVEMAKNTILPFTFYDTRTNCESFFDTRLKNVFRTIVNVLFLICYYFSFQENSFLCVPGEFIGALSLLTGDPSLFSVCAKETSYVVIISKLNFYKYDSLGFFFILYNICNIPNIFKYGYTVFIILPMELWFLEGAVM